MSHRILLRRVGEFQRTSENFNGFQTFPATRRRMPTAHRKFWRPTEFSNGSPENSNGLQETSTASRLFRRHVGELQRLAGNCGGPQSFRMALRRIPTAHRRSLRHIAFSCGALENSHEPQGAVAAGHLFRRHTGESNAAPESSGGSPRSPRACLKVPMSRRALQRPAAVSDGTLEIQTARRDRDPPGDGSPGSQRRGRNAAYPCREATFWARRDL